MLFSLFSKKNTIEVEYDILVPPFDRTPEQMTAAQAKKYFEWYISQVLSRVDYVSAKCEHSLRLSKGKINLSPESLILVWKWFLKTARVEKTSKEELEQMRKQFDHLGESFINKEKLTVVTEYIIRDIGMYMGQVFTKNYSNIYWDYYTKPKSDFFVNRPQLFGFVDKRYNPPFKPTFEPIHMTGIQAAKLFDKTYKETDLLEVFMKWKDWC